ncbi:membrane cofactor protein-like isoform X6 [Xiphophorus hellerii]|uniref:membrane cofactor protein-like isoform X6 n=1 Tax=Xiphophorus hellerii TaxID=8084 RepID=UPI0013B40184|nr:membrane cofactor protein-like isoform X6 [Xiphophorus hellerii]
MGVTAVFILSSLGFAIIAEAQDCSKPAAGLNMNLRDEYITRQTFADGSKVYFACNPGYTPARGSAFITCTAGTWSTVQLQCERKTCGSLGEVSNGHVDYDGIEFGDTATVTCYPGYMLVGRSSFRCEVNGWSGRLATCDAVMCTTPAPVANGTFDPHKDFYLFGEVVRYSCSKGLVLNGSKDIMCSNEGEFSPSPPNCVTQDCSKPAAGPHMNLRDEYITQKTFADGSKVYFACNPGYTPARGSAFITCTAGTWSTVQLQCERKTCGSLGEVSNGHVDYAGIKFGDTATVSCNPGYMLVGRSSFRCEVSGWSGRLPTCDAVKCITPAEVAGGAFDPPKEFYLFGEVVRYSCSKGLVLNGSKDITCSNDGKFSSSPPNCVKVECKDPVIENAVFESGSRPPHGYMATVTYNCKSGYVMHGPNSVTCNITNQWSPLLPVCISKMITPVPTATSATITTTKKPKGEGDAHSPTWIIIGVVLICSCLIGIIIFFIRKKRRRNRIVKDPAKDGEDVALS